MPDFSFEEAAKAGICCGMDEAGRAPLAGPVTAACVYVPPAARTLPFWDKVRDSKKISKKIREELYEPIREHCAFGIVHVEPSEIDDVNIHHASLIAMARAQMVMSKTFGIVPDMALVDGKFVPQNLPCPAQALIGGDDRSKSIAAASILAKVTRDRLMCALHEEFPHYGWDRNAGYPTALHRDAIKIHGITIHHRRSFRLTK